MAFSELWNYTCTLYIHIQTEAEQAIQTTSLRNIDEKLPKRTNISEQANAQILCGGKCAHWKILYILYLYILHSRAYTYYYVYAYMYFALSNVNTQSCFEFFVGSYAFHMTSTPLRKNHFSALILYFFLFFLFIFV